MARLGIAAGNKLGASSGAEVARAGGNAVDACLASAVMAWVAEPFFTSVGGSGFIALRMPDGTVEVIDGNNTMPLSAPATEGQGIERVFLDYSDGMYTGIGGGSVAVPGILSAMGRAWEQHGRIEWAALFEQAIRVAREGLPFPRTSDYYLSCTYPSIWALYEVADTLFTVDGRPLREGELLVQAELAEALEMIADGGPKVFYGGELGREIVDAVVADGGFMVLEDLSSYEAVLRKPISTQAFGWKVESNPPPAVGGAALAHMLALLEEAPLEDPSERLAAIVEAQKIVTGYRGERYLDPLGIAAAFKEAIDSLGLRRGSPETTHSSSADADGYVCAITQSAGYGAGLIVHGVMLNNTLGEEELNPQGVHRLKPGSRCHSSMAPTIATGPNVTVALGSPGADRIVPAIAQTFLRLAVDGDDLHAAVAAPRAHLDPREQGETLCFEPELPGEGLGFIPRPFDEIHMYFGAVQAASVATDGAVDAAHDPRRSGGSILV
jgi:gamma-glutamyltranspeptidase / glutathione hydrolase